MSSGVDGGSVTTSKAKALLSPTIRTLNSGGTVVYGNDVDVLTTDGVLTTSGTMLITIQGLRQGHHLIETR